MAILSIGFLEAGLYPREWCRKETAATYVAVHLYGPGVQGLAELHICTPVWSWGSGTG